MSNGWYGIGGVQVEIVDGTTTQFLPGELFVTDLWSSSDSHVMLSVNGIDIYMKNDEARRLISLLTKAAGPGPEAPENPRIAGARAGSDGICPGDAGGCMGDCMECSPDKDTCEDVPF
jgi:hypothetical protein